MKKWILVWLLIFPPAVFGQVGHWVFEMEAESEKKERETATIHLYAREGGYAIGGSWKSSTRKIVCDSVAGKVLLLNTNGNRKSYSFESLADTVEEEVFDPKVFPDFDLEGKEMKLLPGTKMLCGYETVRLEGSLDHGIHGEIWLAPGVIIPAYPVFTLPDGRIGSILFFDVEVPVLELKMVFRFTQHEVLASVKESVFSMNVPEGYRPLEELLEED